VQPQSPDIDTEHEHEPEPLPGKEHTAGAALCLGIVLPGWGQAYNGQPWKALFYLLFTPLLVPWLLSLIDAYYVGRRIERQGGRYFRGGCLWVALHLWLVANLALLTLVALTVSGVLQ